MSKDHTSPFLLLTGLSVLSLVVLVVSEESPSVIPSITLFSTCYGPSCYPTCYRQPVLVVIPGLGSAGSILAFVEGRNNSYCSGTSDGFPSSIRLRRSSDGQSWSTEKVIYTGSCDFLSAVYDETTKRTHLFIQAPPTGTLYSYSDDAGVTWSTPAPGKVTGPTGYTFIPGVAHGIQLQGSLCPEPSCNGLTGRLLVSFVCHSKASPLTHLQLLDTACPGCYTCLAFSDDHGATWKIEAVSTQEGSREASLVQLQSKPYATPYPVIYATERNMGASTGHRIHAISLNGGNQFSIFGEDLELPDSKVTNWTGIVAGAARYHKDGASASYITFTTPMQKTARADLGLYISTNEATSWITPGKLLFKGPSGYSDIYQFNGTHLAILFENGETEFAERISFSLFQI